MKWRKLLPLLLATSLTVGSNCAWAAGMERNDDDMKNELKKIISEKKKNKTLTGTIIDEDEVNNLPDDSNEFVGEILQDEPKHTSPFTDIKESMVDALNGLNNYCKNKNIQKQ